MSHVRHNWAQRRGRGATVCRGFTLIEILIVVVMLGILAALVLPKFSDAAHTARENTLKDDLRYLRTQIVVYKAQHRDTAPGYPANKAPGAPTKGQFLSQMTRPTDEMGNTWLAGGSVPESYRFGPYLSKMPPNPINSLDDILVVPDGSPLPAPDNSTGWIYKPQTAEIIPNLTGLDDDKMPYANY